MTVEIRAALDKKGVDAAGKLPARFQKTVVVMDTSGSMAGHGTQKLRPMAVALATRDMIVAASSESTVMTADGAELDPMGMPTPQGHTDLASALVRALKSKPDAVFMITDGYENATAGRFAEVLRAARKVGVQTPVFQLTPTFAAEAKGVRSLGDVSVTAVQDPGALGISFVISLMEQDVDQGIAALLGTLPRAIIGAGS